MIAVFHPLLGILLHFLQRYGWTSIKKKIKKTSKFKTLQLSLSRPQHITIFATFAWIPNTDRGRERERVEGREKDVCVGIVIFVQITTLLTAAIFKLEVYNITCTSKRKVHVHWFNEC